jgi:hypothetical protein
MFASELVAKCVVLIRLYRGDFLHLLVMMQLFMVLIIVLKSFRWVPIYRSADCYLIPSTAGRAKYPPLHHRFAMAATDSGLLVAWAKSV